MAKKAAYPKKAKAVSKKAPAAATRKQSEETQVKKEPAANERPASITKDSSDDPQKITNQTPLREPFTSQECPAAKDDNLCRINEQPDSEINNSVLDSPSPLRKIKLATKKPSKDPQVNKEPEANVRPASITKDSPEELQKNRSFLERSTSNQMSQLSVNEILDEPQTKCIKEEPGIIGTRSSTPIKSCVEEPAKKKIKADLDANPSKLF